MAAPAAVLNILVTAQTAQANASILKTQGALKGAEAQATRTSTAMGAKLATAAKYGAAAVGMGLAAALVSSSKKAAEFEQQMSSLGAVTEANGKQMDRLKKQAIALGGATVFSATEAAQAQIELAKGGLKVKEILGGGLPAALALAAAGELDLASAAETTVNAMKLFGLHGKDTIAIADQLATAANITTADVEDFAMALSQGGAVAKQAGYTLNETVTVLEAMADAGIKNSDAGTSMKTAMIQLLKPTEKQTELAKQLGIHWLDQNGELKNASALSKELTQATKGMTGAERAKTFAVLAGTDGFRTLAALYDAGAKKLDNYTAANSRQGTAARVAAKKNDNLRGDIEALGGAVETLQIKVGDKLNPALRTMAQLLTSVLVAAGDEQKLRKTAKGNDAIAAAARGVSAALKILSSSYRHAFGVANESVKRARDIAAGFFKFIKGSVETVAAVFSGDWKKAWNNVKSVFRDGKGNVLGVLKSMTAPVRTFAKAAGSILGSVFDAAWNTVADIFRDGANAVIKIVREIIGVINLIPGVDIGKPDLIANPKNTYRKGTNARRVRGVQRGGMLTGGAPSGDSIPAMLERGEYVLNRKAVQKVGVNKLDALNFQQASRFQSGGRVGMILGGLPGKVVGGAGKLLGEGAGFFIDKLPDPNIPAPLSALGPWLIDKATDFIKNKVTSVFGGGGGSLPGYTGPPADMKLLGNNAWVDSHTLAVAAYLSKKFGVSVSSGWRSVAHNDAVGGVTGSLHTHGSASNPGALDFVPASSALQAWAGKHIAGLQENLIHDVGSGLHNHLGFFQRGGIVNTAKVARRAGWRGKDLMTAIAVAGAESNFDPHANLVTSAEDSRGLWQINTYAHGGGNELYHPFTNAKVAHELWKAQGWSPWAGYTSGNYRAFLGRARDAMKKARLALTGGDSGGGGGGSKPKKPSGPGPYQTHGGVAPPGQKEPSKKAVQAARQALAKANQRWRERQREKLTSSALNLPLLDRIANLGQHIARIQDEAGYRETKYGFASSEAGEELSDNETRDLINLYTGILGMQLGQSKFYKRAKRVLTARLKDNDRNIRQARKTGQRWKIPAYNTIRKDLKSKLGTITTDHETLVGLTGHTGEIWDTRQTLERLGAKGTTTADTGADSQIADLLREQLATSQRALAISQAQMPIFSQFMPRYHSGGVIPGRTEQPVMAMGGEGIFTRDQMAAMGGNVEVTIIVEDGAVDASRIRAEARTGVREAITKSRTGRLGRKSTVV